VKLYERKQGCEKFKILNINWLRRKTKRKRLKESNLNQHDKQLMNILRIKFKKSNSKKRSKNCTFSLKSQKSLMNQSLELKELQPLSFENLILENPFNEDL